MTKIDWFCIYLLVGIVHLWVNYKPMLLLKKNELRETLRLWAPKEHTEQISEMHDQFSVSGLYFVLMCGITFAVLFWPLDLITFIRRKLKQYNSKR